MLQAIIIAREEFLSGALEKPMTDMSVDAVVSRWFENVAHTITPTELTLKQEGPHDVEIFMFPRSPGMLEAAREAIGQQYSIRTSNVG